MESLRNALNVLSKSSPQAVEVEKDEKNRNCFKQYLYIETLIERDFSNKLESLKSGEIIFLCGSSGDGKSAILTRYSKKYREKVRFHLDATHSLDPHKNAIDELDKLFSETNESQKPLVVGINVGMMGNYAEGGSDTHSEIRESMKAHIQGTPPPNHHYYFDFERYPKFEFWDNCAHSNFAEAFMKQLTKPLDNPFMELLEKYEGKEPDLCANFKLLSMPNVQEVIIDALMKARLIKDQFMTARALLDFLHQLLTGPSYLFDNLYVAADNELSQRIIGFDPATIRTKQIDHFILKFQLGLVDDDFKEFCEDLREFGITRNTEPDSFIRLFYLLKGIDFSNNYHRRFESDFSNSLLEQFARIWKLHDIYSDDSPKEEKNALLEFYSDVLLNGLRRYMNRKAPELRDGYYFLTEHNNIKIVAALKIKADLTNIAKETKQRQINNQQQPTVFFNAYIKVNENPLTAIAVSINLYDLLIKLKAGYRPNKHDKSNVLILEELIAQIVDVANQGDSLLFFDDADRYEIERSDDDLQVGHL
jgi:DNA phosphorothioation-dependent restriction protein DptF